MRTKVKHFLIRGDCHGNFDWVNDLPRIAPHYRPEETGVIILGDSGLNFFLNARDQKKKRFLQNSGYTFFLVQGNHEQDPSYLEGIGCHYDGDYNGFFYSEMQYPRILYFLNGMEYHLNNYRVYVAGGAYSVDKPTRFARANITDDDTEERKIKLAYWFPHEQMSESQRNTAIKVLKNPPHKTYHFVFTHTCPLSWEPRDLFFPSINQSLVDKTTEIFLDEIKDLMTWKVWCFGHFHADRIERRNVQQYYNKIEDLDTVWDRWYGELIEKD